MLPGPVASPSPLSPAAGQDPGPPGCSGVAGLNQLHRGGPGGESWGTGQNTNENAT